MSNEREPEEGWCKRCDKNHSCTYWNEFSIKCPDFVMADPWMRQLLAVRDEKIRQQAQRIKELEQAQQRVAEKLRAMDHVPGMLPHPELDGFCAYCKANKALKDQALTVEGDQDEQYHPA